MQETGDAGSAAVGSPVSPEQVLKTLMNDGHFDSLRVKILNQLKQNVEEREPAHVSRLLTNLDKTIPRLLKEEIKKYTSALVERSKVLNTPGAESKSRRELFEALRKELEEPVLEKASMAAWGIILDKEGVGKEITEKVDAVYARLRGNDSSSSSPQYHITPHFQDRSMMEPPLVRDSTLPATSANGNSNQVHHHQGQSSHGQINQRSTDRGSTPRNDVAGTPSTRRGGREEDYYHPPLYDQSHD